MVVHLTCYILLVSIITVVSLSFTATAGTNKAASSSTTLNTRKLDEETENLAREFIFLSNDHA